ncbi:hypothetical protein [Haloferula sp.]|uniref:hypothetical protein n=1 Tax=Haloferula sp. TaxID=2497595 RepID=UPI003C785270
MKLNTSEFVDKSCIVTSLSQWVFSSTSSDSKLKTYNVMKPIIPFALLGALFAVGANAAVTDPVGYVTIPLPGTGGGAPQALQVASQQLLPGGSTEFAGVAEGFGSDGSGTFLQDDDGTWAAGDFYNSTDSQFTSLVEITSGPLVGTLTWITGSDVDKLYTFDDISAAGADAGFKVIRAFTVSSLLGDVPTSDVLGGATSISSADNFLLYNSAANAYTTFWYKTGGPGGVGWRSDDGSITNPAESPIHPVDSGIIFVRKQSAGGSLVIAGDVKTGVTDVVIRGGGGTGPSATTLNIVQVPYPVDQLTPDNSGLYTGDPATGLAGATSISSADSLLVFDSATNSYTTFWYKTGGPGGIGWRSDDGSIADPANQALSSTSAILIQRKASGSDFTWAIPPVTIAP